MINVIIFSKDRACQLDLLIRSLKKHWKIKAVFNISYHYSSEEYRKGYDKLREKYNFVEFYLRKDCKNDIVELLRSEAKYTAFLTDDDVFVGGFEEDPLFKKFEKLALVKNNILCFSLRLGKNIKYSYTLDKKEKVPIAMRLANKWRWKTCAIDWGYPMSIDGHIFLSDDIVPLIKTKEFSNPNKLEEAMALDTIDKPFMMCYDKPKLINLAMNRVQDTFSNRCGNISTGYLNGRYLNDEVIALEPIEEFAETINSCHVEYNPSFIRS